MGTNVANPPKLVAAPIVARSAPTGALWPTIQLLSPLVAAATVLALDRFLPNARETSPLLESKPALKSIFPLLVSTILVLFLFLSVLQIGVRFIRPWTRHNAPLVAGLLILLGIWDLVTLKLDWLDQTFFPGPDEVFAAMAADRWILLESAWRSLRLLLSGYLAGVCAGIVTGVLIGWFPRVRYWGMPALKIVGPIPATALIPLVMTIWTESFWCSMALIAFAVWFPVTILTSSGIANVRLSYLDVARTLGAGRGYLIFRVAIPAALPTIFIGLFMGLTASFLTLMVAEAPGVRAGLGYYLNWRQGSMEYPAMYGALILSAVFFSTLLTLLFKFRDWALRWQKGVIKW
jgi:NitT/TauT family transport system permease protein